MSRRVPSVTSPWWRFRHSWGLRVVLLALRRHPMCRRSDRVEAATVTVTAILSLLAIPLAVVVGMWVFSSSMTTVHHEASERHEVLATVIATSADQTIKSTVAASEVTVAWRGPGGRRFRDVIPVIGAPATGSHLTVWINRAGQRMAPPFTASQAEVQADAAGIAVAVGVLGLAGLVLATVRRSLLRGRVRAWDAEWIEVGSQPTS